MIPWLGLQHSTEGGNRDLSGSGKATWPRFRLCTWRGLLILLLQPRCDTTRVLLFYLSEFGAGGLHTLLHTTIMTHKATRWRHTDRMFACVALLGSGTPDLLEFSPVIVSSLRRRWLFVGPATEQGRLPGMCHQSGMAFTPSSLLLEKSIRFLKVKTKLVWEDEPCDADRCLLRKATESTDARAGSLAHPGGAWVAGRSFCDPLA